MLLASIVLEDRKMGSIARDLIVDAQRFTAKVIYVLPNDNLINSIACAPSPFTGLNVARLRVDHVLPPVSSIPNLVTAVAERRRQTGQGAVRC